MAEAAQFQGTRRASARRRLRRAASALIGVPLLTGLLHVPAAPEAQAAPSAPASRTVDVSIDSLTPAAPTKSDTITVSGTVTNKGGSTIDDARIGLRRGPSLNSRSAIENAAARKGFTPGADGQEVRGEKAVEIERLPAGITRAFTLKVSAEDLRLGDDGVYLLGVSLTGRTTDRPAPQVLGFERTFLPWQPSEAGKKTRISFLWPLISPTRLTAQTDTVPQQGDSAPEQTPIFRDDELAEEISPGGRLQQLVALGEELPVTWVIDPDLLASVDAMTKDYKIQETDGKSRAGQHQEVAKQWLKALDEAVEGRQIVALPFADPDLASLAHRGKDVSGALGHLRPATELASTTVESILGRKPRTDFAWPVEGAVDSSIVDVATSAGARNVITRSDSMRETGSFHYTPNAARPIGSGNTAVVSDALLSTSFRGDLARADTSTLAVQKFLAHTHMINMQAPGKLRSVVVAPQRMPTAGQAQAMAAALRALDSGRWSGSQTLGEAVEAKPDPSATRRVPGGGAYPASLRKQELPTTAFEEIQRTQSTLAGFEVILSQPDRVVVPFGNAVRRELSTSWRGDAQGAQDFRNDVQSYLSGLTKQVKLLKKSTQTLSGRSATIPVTVQNNLVQGVEGMTLVLTSRQPNRLDLVQPQQAVEIGSGHIQLVKFPAAAHANGPVRVTAQLYTKDGRPYGEEMTFRVNVTEITSTVMLVMAGGVLLLVLAGVRMYTQRKRAANREATARERLSEAAAGGGETAGGPAGTAADAPEEAAPSPVEPPGERTAEGSAAQQAGEVPPDTRPGSTRASGTGEKVDR